MGYELWHKLYIDISFGTISISWDDNDSIAIKIFCQSNHILAVIPPESPNEFDLHLRNSMQTLTNLSESYSLDAYISTLDGDSDIPNRIYNDLRAKGYSL